MLKVRVNTALAALGVLPAIIGVQLLSSMLKMLFFRTGLAAGSVSFSRNLLCRFFSFDSEDMVRLCLKAFF